MSRLAVSTKVGSTNSYTPNSFTSSLNWLEPETMIFKFGFESTRPQEKTIFSDVVDSAFVSLNTDEVLLLNRGSHVVLEKYLTICF